MHIKITNSKINGHNIDFESGKGGCAEKDGVKKQIKDASELSDLKKKGQANDGKSLAAAN